MPSLVASLTVSEDEKDHRNGRRNKMTEFVGLCRALTFCQRIQVFKSLESLVTRPAHHQFAIVDEDAHSELAALPIDGRSDPRDV